jgi:hypothetical protein
MACAEQAGVFDEELWFGELRYAFANNGIKYLAKGAANCAD